MHNQMATQSLVLPVLGHINLSVTFVGPPTHRHTRTQVFEQQKHSQRYTYAHSLAQKTQRRAHFIFFLCWSTLTICASARKQESGSEKNRVHWRGLTMSMLAVKS